MADNEKRPDETNEIESLNEGSLNAEDLSIEDLEQVAGGLAAAGCTDFTGSCERFSGTCTGFGGTTKPGETIQPGTSGSLG